MERKLQPLCEEETFDQFFRTHVSALRNYIYYQFGEEEAANDVAQDSFIALWKNCGKVTLDTAKAYVYQIANNLSKSLKRHEKVKLKYEAYSAKPDRSNESPEFVILENEFMEQLNQAIASLPDKQREVFLMNRIEKLTYKEIAEIKQVSQKAIEKLMHKALLKLREQINFNQ